MKAVGLAAQSVILGEAEIVVVAGGMGVDVELARTCCRARAPATGLATRKS